MSNIVPFNEMQQMAVSVAKSGMFNLKSVEQATTLMLIAQAEGIAPIQAVQMYSVINGMPSLKSTEIQARFQRAGGKVNWLEASNEKALVELTIDGQSYKSEFTLADAKRMGLDKKDNWVKMPKQMCMARAMAMGVRAIYPSCLNNMYSVDEMQDTIAVEPTPATKPKVEHIEAEIELTPEPSIGSLKLKLANRLKKYSFSSGDIKSFAIKFDLADNKALLEKVVNDEELLKEMVTEFEAEEK